MHYILICNCKHNVYLFYSRSRNSLPSISNSSSNSSRESLPVFINSKNRENTKSIIDWDQENNLRASFKNVKFGPGQRYCPIQIWLDKNGIPGKTCMKSKEICLTNIESMAQMAHLWSDQTFKMKNIPYTCHSFTIHAFGITRFYKKINVEITSIVWKMFQYCLFLVFLHWFNFTNWIQPHHYLVH